LKKADFVSLLQEEIPRSLRSVDSMAQHLSAAEVRSLAKKAAKDMSVMSESERALYLEDLIEECSTSSAKPYLRLSREAVIKILESVFDTIVTRLCFGDDVRISPWGKFYPKTVRRSGLPMNIKLGWTSYKKMDQEITARWPFPLTD
jgi:nucleoid DNA-binding protein